jgi:2-keto-myo-inositol isomerase
MKSCLNQNTLRTTATEAFLQAARRAEFDAVELTMGKIEPIIEKGVISQLKRTIEDNGLRVASINGPENFNLLAEQEFETLLSRIRKLATVSREIGCNLLVPVPSVRKSNASRQMIVTQTAQSLKKLSETCGENIRLGLEFLGQRECSVNNLETAVEAISLFANRNVGLVVDSFHMHLSGTDFSQLAKIKGDRLFLVHVNDSEKGDRSKLSDANRVLPGEGVMDLPEFRANLARVGYDSFVSLELFRESYWEQNPDDVAKIGRESLRRVFGV